MNLLFLKEYIKDIRNVGAIAPSSRFLARKMLKSIDFDTAKVIIEYGPGTGVFTNEIAGRIKPDTTLIVIETNPIFYQKLCEKYKSRKNIEIINASAADIHSLQKSRSLPAPDYIISGLPFAALPAHVSKKILRDTSKLLGNTGEFITFQYTLLKKPLLNSYFNSIIVSRELRNIPPAYILRCKRLE